MMVPSSPVQNSLCASIWPPLYIGSTNGVCAYMASVVHVGSTDVVHHMDRQVLLVCVVLFSSPIHWWPYVRIRFANSLCVRNVFEQIAAGDGNKMGALPINIDCSEFGSGRCRWGF
jgi:hypothetical protein